MPRTVTSDADRETITEVEMTEAMFRSGYLLEYRAEEFFRKRQLLVEASAAFPDSSSGKSREIDLLVRTAESIYLKDVHMGNVVARIIIECKNNPQPVCFFLKPRSSVSYGELIKNASHPYVLAQEDGYVPIVSALEMPAFHHYATRRVATQYCTFQKKRDAKTGDRWQAMHTETDFDSFEKLCDAVEFFVEKDRKYLEHLPRVHKKKASVYLTYPILLLGGKLFESEPSKGSLRLKEAEHLHFIRTRAGVEKTEQHCIDVITENYLAALVTQIKFELKEISKRLASGECEVLLKSIAAF